MTVPDDGDTPATSVREETKPKASAINETTTVSKFAEIDDIVAKAQSYLQTNGSEDPVEILRYMQKLLVYGRPLEDASEALEGTTNFILVDRSNLLKTAFDEIKALEESSLRKTLQVEFYGKVRNHTQTRALQKVLIGQGLLCVV